MSEEQRDISRRTLLGILLGGGSVAAFASFLRLSSGQPAPATDEDPRQTGSNPAAALDGENAKTHVINRGSHRGENNFTYFLDEAALGLDEEQPDEVYSSVHVKLGSDWEQPTASDTAKIFWAGCNLSAGRAGQGGFPPTGDDGWSVRVYTRGPVSDGKVTAGAYVYHLDQSGDFGTLWRWPDGLTVGEWNHIESFVKLNSVDDGSARADGIVQMWLDGSIQLDRRDIRWRTTEELGFDRLGPGSYWGGSGVSPENNVLQYSQFSYTTEPEAVDRELGTAV